MKIIVQEEWFNVQQCLDNPNNIYIFGDNGLRIGEGGQAQIRNSYNVIGIATKRLPTRELNSFFNDSFSDVEIINSDLRELYEFMEKPESISYTFVFPKDGLGTGLSELEERSPMICELLKSHLLQWFGISTKDDGTLFKSYKNPIEELEIK